VSADAIAAIEPAITRLVQEAPARDVETLHALDAALAAIGTPLACSIARILGLVAAERVDPGVALPALAEACATLVADARHGVDTRALEAARYRIETLEPLEARPPKLGAPDVPVDGLSRGPRRQT
jgi:hypothetical protein